MIYFYVKERTTLNNGQYVELWMRRDGHDKDVFVDGYLKDYFSQYEIDLTFDQEMASLYRVQEACIIVLPILKV